MRIKVDKDSDALYFRLDENDKVVGVEFLGISARATNEELSLLSWLRHGFAREQRAD